MREEIKKSLDEIDACVDRLENKKMSDKVASQCRGWLRKHKEKLKELGYKGKIRRKRR